MGIPSPHWPFDTPGIESRLFGLVSNDCSVSQTLLTQHSFVVVCSQDAIVRDNILALLLNTGKLCRLFGIRIRLLNSDVSGCGTELAYFLGTFVLLAAAPANLLFVFSRFSLARYPGLCFGYTASAGLAPSEIFKIFFTVPISLSAFRTMPITLDSCSVGEGIAVSIWRVLPCTPLEPLRARGSWR